ncbi:hypothetical protein CEUSTIGMA_g8558.t1 [Chlamydomonas eustigma]|uniref:Protein kinase domain-containing protein n=1 Tax=Chlamydomonas eustigma TaxID=1157962 RepID=A0A250XDG4_9CHLO|nr:hypothetical protein CEUSTIGMA_g8558.t1 [Chlamydomonas eustigma]|eukprot:GAX81124.1 hypothetical protein CEUSTIGMA_g8558.t1 [Chlamydomonas eustigma]
MRFERRLVLPSPDNGGKAGMLLRPLSMARLLCQLLQELMCHLWLPGYEALISTAPHIKAQRLRRLGSAPISFFSPHGNTSTHLKIPSLPGPLSAPPPNNLPTSTALSNNSVGLAVGVGFGGAALIILIAMVVWWIWRQKTRHRARLNLGQKSQGLGGSLGGNGELGYMGAAELTFRERLGSSSALNSNQSAPNSANFSTTSLAVYLVPEENSEERMSLQEVKNKDGEEEGGQLQGEGTRMKKEGVQSAESELPAKKSSTTVSNPPASQAPCLTTNPFNAQTAELATSLGFSANTCSLLPALEKEEDENSLKVDTDALLTFSPPSTCTLVLTSDSMLAAPEHSQQQEDAEQSNITFSSPPPIWVLPSVGKGLVPMGGYTSKGSTSAEPLTLTGPRVKNKTSSISSSRSGSLPSSVLSAAAIWSQRSANLEAVVSSPFARRSETRTTPAASNNLRDNHKLSTVGSWPTSREGLLFPPPGRGRRGSSSYDTNGYLRSSSARSSSRDLMLSGSSSHSTSSRDYTTLGQSAKISRSGSRDLQSAGSPILHYMDPRCWEGAVSHIPHAELTGPSGRPGSQLVYLCAGSYGIIYRGKWKGKDVVVKKLECEGPYRCDLDVVREAFIMSRFKDIANANVATVYGLSRDADSGLPSIVMPYYPHGSIRDILDDAPPELLTDLARLGFALDIAKGMAYLHDRPEGVVIHGNLKPSGLLVSNYYKVHISDFALASMKVPTFRSVGSSSSHSSSSSSSLAFSMIASNSRDRTVAYSAPELLESLLKAGVTEMSSERTKAGDVYSFAMILYELFTGRTPYQGATEGEILGYVYNGLRPHMLINTASSSLTSPSSHPAASTTLGNQEFSHLQATAHKHPLQPGVGYSSVAAAAAAAEVSYSMSQPSVGMPNTRPVPAQVAKLIEACWDPEPLKRPPFSSIVNEILSMAPLEGGAMTVTAMRLNLMKKAAESNLLSRNKEQ